MKPLRRHAVALLVVGLPLGGCVTSQFPLLDEKTAIADATLTGHFAFTGEQKAPDYDVYLNGKKYLLAVNGKLAYVGTVHPWKEGVYLGQLRPTSEKDTKGEKKPAAFAYMLVKKEANKVMLNFIGCKVTESCAVSDAAQLLKWASDALGNPDERQLATAVKESESGQ